jgi:hypothetical protein
LAAGFAKELLAMENATPSVSYKLFLSYDPEAVLWLGFTSKDEAVRERFNLFLKVWPEARQRIPHALMQEMRITAELPSYREIVQSLFLELLDGKLTTPEELRAFLEPHSPPAPPPKETIKRPRAKRGEAKLKDDSFDEDEEDSEENLDDEEDLDDIGGEDDDLGLDLHLPKVDLEIDLMDESDTAVIATEDEDVEDEDEEEHPTPAPPTDTGKRASKSAAEPKGGKDKQEAAKSSAASSSLKPAKEAKSAPVSARKAASKPEAKHAPAKAAPVQAKKPVPPAKPASKNTPVAKPTAKIPAKPAVKAAKASAPGKTAPVSAPSHKAGQASKASKPVAKKSTLKPGKNR